MTAEFWEYDPRIGKRWNTDPKGNAYTSFYAVFKNDPIWYSDPLGDSTEDWVKDAKGNITWDKNAHSQATTKAGDTYIGKTLMLKFNSYIDKNLWDGPSPGTSDPSGDKLTTTIFITGQQNSEGELVGLAAGSHVQIGHTPLGKGRAYYPGLGKDQNKFNLTYDSKQGFNLTVEQHASVSAWEQFGLYQLGFNIVNVAQKLDINVTQGKLSVTSFTDIFPSATLSLNGTVIMQYNQPSFSKNFELPLIGQTFGESGLSTPIYDYSLKPPKWYKR